MSVSLYRRCCVALLWGALATGVHGAVSLEDGFACPPLSARPETWWHWMNGNVSREGIVADLDAMAAIGIGGVHIFDAGCSIPAGPLAFGTIEWYDTVRFAVQEAAKRKMSVTLANCSGYSAAGGPWIAASNAMKTVCYTTTDVCGGRMFDGVLPAPEDKFGFYEDIAVVAYPVPLAERSTMEESGGEVSISDSGNRKTVLVNFAEAFSASMLEFRLFCDGGWEKKAKVRLEHEAADGWRTVLEVETFAVDSAQINRNLRSYAFPEVVSPQWRLSFSFPSSANGFYVDGVRLSRGARVQNVANKAFFVRTREKTSPYEASPGQIVKKGSVFDLSSKVDSSGRLRWDVPSGMWRILRVGYAANGKCCHPASKNGVGYESDKLSRSATDLHFDSYIGKLCDILGPRLSGAVEWGFNAVLVDSWEAGSQNWTQGFEKEFAARAGYDIKPWLPVLAGAVVGSVGESERFLSDFRDVLSHMFAENFAGELARKCHERGLKLVVEPYGAFPSSPDLYCRAADIPMCEFWVPPAFGLGDRTVKLVAEMAHCRNPRGIVAAEAFTGKPDESRWQQDPFSLKAVGDQMYAIGVNRVVYHRYAHQPWTDRRYSPGMTMGAWGTHFERTETWWYDAKDWIAYQTRCQYLLQTGEFAGSSETPDVRWLRRRYENGTVGFFVACGNAEMRTVKVELPAVARSVELWDAETGEMSLAGGWHVEDGHTLLDLEFKPSGSVFVMFRPSPTTGAKERIKPMRKGEAAVPGPWRVEFAATYDPPDPIVLDRLCSLSMHETADVRHFSGSATYSTKMAVCRSEGERVVLDLGDVKNLAEVVINGRKFPVLWRPPFMVDVSDAIPLGQTTVELSVRVVNLWVNRLVGDEELPPDVKWQGDALAEIPEWVRRGEASPTGRKAFATWHHWRKGDALPPSGLIGPVRIVVESDSSCRKTECGLRDLYSDTWDAIDGLGRVTERAGIPAPRGKKVGMFYWTWHQGGFANKEPFNNAKFIADNPGIDNELDDPRWGPTMRRHHWDEPLFGYYRTTDKWVLRRHAQLLSAAGVDVVIFDSTNLSFTWLDSLRTLGETWCSMRGDGNPTPQFAYMLNFGENPMQAKSIMELYREIYRPAKFRDLWFLWNGKPLVHARPDVLEKVMRDPSTREEDRNDLKEILGFFTFRPLQPSYTAGPKFDGQWTWLEVYPQHPCGPKAGGGFEMCSAGVAQNHTWKGRDGHRGLAAMNDINVMGRAYVAPDEKDLAPGEKLRFASDRNPRRGEPDRFMWGDNFAQQMRRAREIDPDYLFVTGWNEGIADMFPEWFGTKNAFPDQFSPEFSRDIEPSAGILKDHFYCQLVQEARQFKGARRQRASDENPIYRDAIGDVAPRDSAGYGKNRYVDDSGRNDIVECFVSHDAEKVVFRVECAAPVTQHTDKSWMRLFVSVALAPDDRHPNWNHFHFVVNRVSPPDGRTAVLESCEGGWKWREAARVPMKVEGKSLTLVLPRNVLGLDKGKVNLWFKWSDNSISEKGDVLDFYRRGDAAPDGRFMYRYFER